MAESLEKQFCDACGEEVRANALFCFNCGSQVASDEAVEADIEREKQVSNAWFKEELTENPTVATNTPVPQKVKAKVKETLKTEEKQTTSTTEKKTELPAENSFKLKSAAAIKDRSKLGGRKTVEIEWDTPRSAPNIWFLLVSFILAGFAAFILFAMLYIR